MILSTAGVQRVWAAASRRGIDLQLYLQLPEQTLDVNLDFSPRFYVVRKTN